MYVSSLETLMLKSVEAVGADGGEGLCPCPGPDGLQPVCARHLLAIATGAATVGPDLPAGRPGPRCGTSDVTGLHILQIQDSQTNTCRTDQRHGFGKAISYAVQGATDAMAALMHLVAAKGHGKEPAVRAMSETGTLPAWCDRRPLRPSAKLRCRSGLSARYPAYGTNHPAKGQSLRG
jgi:hypothetical protein